MQHLHFSSLSDIGINPLTGESCAYSMRILCDLSEQGVALVHDYFGIPTSSPLARNWNSMVGHSPAVASILLDRDAFSALMRFALFRRGHQYIVGHEGQTDFSGFSDKDLEHYPGLQMYLDGTSVHTEHPTFRLWRNPKIGSTAPSEGSRNVHQFTGRTA